MTQTVDIGEKVKDLKGIMQEITENFVQERSWDSCDECKFCGYRYGNYYLLLKENREILHNEGCIVSAAKEWLKYIEDYEYETKSI